MRVNDVIAFDGDDTLWHNEPIFSMTQNRFRRLMSAYVEEPVVEERLLAIEMRNLRIFGYGIKGFVLSMIETAIEISDQRADAGTIQTIIDFGKEMLAHPVELLDGVRGVIEELSPHYRLLVVTKGDLFDQESKLARSGLADLFWRIEIVSEKDEAVYHRIMRTHHIAPEEFVMVGNSIRSDILPVVATGATAVYVPYHMTWIHERAELPKDMGSQIHTLSAITELPGLLAARQQG